MPRLPGPEALGGLPSMRGGSPAQISGRNPVAEAAGRIGQGLVALSEDQRQREESLQAAEADARLTTGLTDLRRRFDTDPDFETFQPRFQEEANRIQQEAGSLITSPRLRERWQPRSAVAVSSAFDHVRGRQDRLRGEHDYDRLEGTLRQRQASYLEAPDDATRQTARQDILDNIALGRRAMSGVVSEERFRRLTDRYYYGTIEEDARRRLNTEDGYAALLELTEGDGRVNQPSTGGISEVGLAQLEQTARQPGMTPSQVRRAQTSIRTEAEALSALIKDAPLTQAQHDALVSFGVVRGREALQELLPLIASEGPGRIPSLSQAMRTRGGLMAQEQPSGERPADSGERLPRFSGQRSSGFWGNDQTWRQMDGVSRAAAMALLEADNRSGRPDVASARNALGAMINRADRDGQDLGEHVSQRIYQPTIEPEQYARLARIVGSPEHRELVELANSRLSGQTPDWVNGATHFLAAEATMLGLEAREPNKYRSWRQWTGFDPQTNQYRGVIMRDGSHAFLAPEGVHSAQFGGGGGRTRVAQRAGTMTDAGPSDRRIDEYANLVEGRAPSSRYADLPPERRRVLERAFREGLRPQFMADMDDDIEMIQQTGQERRLPDGTTSFTRAARTQVLTTNQLERYQLKREEAQAQYRALHGLQDMTQEEMDHRSEQISNAPGERFGTLNRTRNMFETARERLREEGQRDGAQSVEGGISLRGVGKRRRETMGPNGEPILSSETDIDHRLAPAREVAEAHDFIRRRHGRYLTIGADENGALSIQPVESIGGQDAQETARRQQDAWRIIIDARMDAQARRGIPEHLRTPITRTEAERLLAMPRRVAEEDFGRYLRAATDRAHQLYGPYARQALDAAFRFRANLSPNQRSDVGSALREMVASGGPITPHMMNNVARLMQLEREESAWNGTLHPGQGLRGIAGTEPRPMLPSMSQPSPPPPRWFQSAPQAQPSSAGPAPAPATTTTRRQQPVGAGVSLSWPKPTPEDIADIQRYPHRQPVFDGKFGPGAAAAYLQGQGR